MRLFVFTALLLLITTPLQAQDACLALVQTTILNALNQCTGLDEGEVCRSTSGTTAQAADLSLLEPTALDVELGEWGLIVAELPEARMIVFGDVTLENLGAGVETVDLVVSSRTGAFARSQPDVEARVVSPLIAGQEVIATGRTSDSSWLRLALPDGEVGWVIASAVNPINGGTLRDLESVSPRQDEVYLPLQGFNFTSGIADAPCPDAPESGILIQTPEERDFAVTVNGMRTQFSGTIYLQAAKMDELIVHVMEGEAAVTIDDEDNTLQAGERLVIGETTTRTTYDYDRVELLPYELLQRQIIIANDWQASVIPAQPRPLADVSSSDTCTIAVTDGVNVRIGPGEAYPARGTLLANQSFNPTGRAVGVDGHIWWRLAGGAWIRFNVGIAAGDCNVVPMVEALPRLLASQ